MEKTIQRYSLFLQLKVLKFYDLVDYSILLLMLKAHKRRLPIILRKRFEKRESEYNFKGTEIFKKHTHTQFKTKLMGCCVSVKGVHLWNNLTKEIKESRSKFTFKRTLKGSMLRKHHYHLCD